MSARRSMRHWRALACLVPLLGAVAARAADGVRSPDPTAPAPAPPERKELRALLNRWLDALGGGRQLMKLKSMDRRCRISFGGGRPEIEVQVRADSRGPYRYDFELNGSGRLIQAFDGNATWQRSDTLGFGQLTAEDHATNQAGADMRLAVHDAAYAYSVAQVLPDELVDGKKCQVLAFSDPAGRETRWYFEAATGLRLVTETKGAAGVARVESSDFRRVPVGGILEPYRVVRTFNGRSVVTTVQDVLYDEEPLDVELFAAPRGSVEDNKEIERILYYNRQVIGLEALRRVRTRVTKALVEVTTSGQKIATRVSQKRPNLLLVEQEAPGIGTSWEGFDGKVGWAWNELQGYRTMQGAELVQILDTADLEGPLRLSAECPLRRLLEEKVENGRWIVGIAMANFAGQAGNFYFDNKTFDLVRVETFIQAGADGRLKVVADFADFRRVDGVAIPFVTTLTNPAMQMVTRVQSVVQNVALDDAIFQPRQDGPNVP